MKKEITILLIEDDPDDAKMVDYQLKKLKTDYKIYKASNRAEFLNLLSTYPNIIISDFNLPDIDGFEILEIIKEKGIIAPVIIVSGTIGEEKAVSLILRGANDYILKDRLLRLTPAIERELDEAESRKEKANAEKALIIAKEKAEESDRLKSIFLANICHEIRTPLNGIMGFVRLLKPNLPIDKQENYIDIVVNSSNQLLKIMDNILDISIIETKEVLIEREKINIKRFLDEIYHTYLDMHQTKKPDIEFTISYNDKLKNSAIITDKSKLLQILTNLLDNAFKFTNNGKIELISKIRENELEICIKDTGIGIQENSQEIIFQHFRQAHNGISQLYGGTGLGLAICKNLVEIMGGHISVKSKLGFGSEFIFSLPVEYQSESDINDKSIDSNEEFDFKNAEILIAEDESVNYMLLQEFFNNTNCKLHHATDGSQVYEILIQNNKIELILMDIKMPNMNGVEALKQIRDNNIEIPVIAQTAYTIDYNEAQLISMGFDDYIAKPINRELLLSKVSRFLKTRTLVNK